MQYTSARSGGFYRQGPDRPSGDCQTPRPFDEAQQEPCHRPVWRFGNSPDRMESPERISESSATLANQWIQCAFLNLKFAPNIVQDRANFKFSTLAARPPIRAGGGHRPLSDAGVRLRTD
jgi:hypothetical protein